MEIIIKGFDNYQLEMELNNLIAAGWQISVGLSLSNTGEWHAVLNKI
jgi:hypothetical protein